MIKKRKFRKKTNTMLGFLAFSKIEFLRSFGVVLVLLLTLLYIFQVAEMSREVYLIQAYNREVRDIMEENRKNEYDFLKANSVSRAEGLIGDLDYVRIEEPHYINIPEPQVASK